MIERDLWKTFHEIGHVVDVFIARKMSKAGKRFGFVRFVGVADNNNLEKALNDLWIGKYRIRANLAKFGRNKGS